MTRFLRNDEFYLKFISCVVFVKKLWFFHVTELKICVRFPSLYLLAINVLFQTYIDSFKCNMFICSCSDHMDFDIATLPQISPFFVFFYWYKFHLIWKGNLLILKKAYFTQIYINCFTFSLSLSGLKFDESDI